MIFRHMGYLVCSLEHATNDLKNILSWKSCSQVYLDETQQVKIQFLKVSDTAENSIELIEPLPSNRQLNRLLASKGDILYHACYEVSDLDSRIAEFKERGAILVAPPAGAVAFGNRTVAFFYIRPGFLIELLEGEKNVS